MTVPVMGTGLLAEAELTEVLSWGRQPPTLLAPVRDPDGAIRGFFFYGPALDNYKPEDDAAWTLTDRAAMRLHAISVYVRGHIDANADWVRIDPDGDPCKGLPWFDW